MKQKKHTTSNKEFVKPVFSNRLLIPLPSIKPTKVNFCRKPENDCVIKRVQVFQKREKCTPQRVRMLSSNSMDEFRNIDSTLEISCENVDDVSSTHSSEGIPRVQYFKPKVDQMKVTEK